MYNHNKAQQSKNRVHISWDILYLTKIECDQNVSYSISVQLFQLMMYFNSLYGINWSYDK